MAPEIEKIQKIMKMKSLKKDYDKRMHNPLKDDIERDDYQIDDYIFKNEEFSF